MLASVATVARYESATCDEGRFISPEECALAPLDLSPEELRLVALQPKLNNEVVTAQGSQLLSVVR